MTDSVIVSLRTSPLGINLIKSFEGCKLKAYLCPAGVWTIGYGHTASAGLPLVNQKSKLNSEAEAFDLLRHDIDNFEDQVIAVLGGTQLEVYQFDALVSFAYNAGIGNLKSSTLLKKIKAGDFEGAAAQFLRWNKAKVNGVSQALEGLTRRRRAEQALFMGDLKDVAGYVGADFGDMPQAILPPAPPKSITKSKTSNASILTTIGGGTAAVSKIAENMNAQTKAVVQPLQDTSLQIQGLSQQVQSTAQSGQATVQSGVDAINSVNASIAQSKALLMHLSGALPWVMVLVIVMLAGGYIIYDRHKKLHEEGV